jgi:hypothetical protein
MKPISLIPDRFGVRRDAAQALFRSATIQYLAAARRQHFSEVVKEWPGLTVKAATSPTSVADFGVGVLAPADIPIVVAPASAFAALAARGLTVDLSGAVSVRIPVRIVDVNDAGGFVAGRGSILAGRAASRAADAGVSGLPLSSMTEEFASHKPGCRCCGHHAQRWAKRPAEA